MKELLPNIFSYSIPDDAWGVKITDNGHTLYYNSNSLPGSISAKIILFKDGPYKLLFLSNDVTEEQLEDAAILKYVDYSEFERFAEGYPLYDYGKLNDGTWNYLTTDLKISFHSLLRFHNLSGNQAILLKTKHT